MFLEVINNTAAQCVFSCKSFGLQLFATIQICMLLEIVQANKNRTHRNLRMYKIHVDAYTQDTRCLKNTL